MSAIDAGCPVWCIGEHNEPGDAMALEAGYFHDNSREAVHTLDGAQPWFVGVSEYVTVAGIVEPATVELQGTGRLTPSEATLLADLLYIAVDIASSDGRHL